MDAGCKWFHITAHTYGAWLYGDLRGFRTRHHREHIEGDYRNSPPPGKYADKRRRSIESLKQDPVKLDPEMRAVVGAARRERLVGLGAKVIAAAMSATHAHVLAQLPDSKDVTRDWVGLAKKHAWYLGREKGHSGQMWGKRSKATAIKDRGHQENTFNYIVRHKKERGGLDVPRPASTTKPTLCKVWAWNSTYNGLHAATTTTAR